MKGVLLTLVTLMAFAPVKTTAQCNHDCTTTVQVLGCGDTPVKGVEVELTLRCQAEHVRKRTGDDGKAIFLGVYWRDIESKKIEGIVDLGRIRMRR